ncbi:ATP-binding cassette domain-containing protein [Gemelliphila asaccharolytica]|uniref:ABC transporter, ATP-binding protein n=1 Tax=Gemelliphila asaccharolytica TaxID=502393 RepID=A0ABR5TLJ0_9BACL|nr:ABC transporter ATP-binding protein [Gemella asaccharolytica]KXB57722.1 ABC transporter, ATP-binding protein [Gemella asaccharolytica]
MKNNILTIKNLSFQRRKKDILKNVNLNLKKGEIVLLCGASGCGKSTLAGILSGYYPLHGGKCKYDKIAFENENLNNFNKKERLEKIAVSFQNARLSFCMNTLREELTFILENLEENPKYIPKIIESHAEIHHLETFLDKPFDTMSGGELQKASFCSIDIINPKLYVLDEPFANLDVNNILKLQNLIKKKLSEGKTFLIIDHRIDLWNFADRLCLLGENGEILTDNLSVNEKNNLLIEEGIILENMKKPKKYKGSDIILEAKNLTIKVGEEKTGQKTLLENVSFNFKKGQLIALTGESGCGKSTLFSAILKQISYTGEIIFNNKNIKKYKKFELFKNLGLVFQDPSLQLITTKVIDEISIGNKNNKKKGEIFLKNYNLYNKKDFSPWTLSQGEQRRLAVICLLVHGEKLLLIDEPTFGQDFKNANKIMWQLKDLCNKGLTCCFTSHDSRLVDIYADEKLKIENKKVRIIDDRSF